MTSEYYLKIYETKKMLFLFLFPWLFCFFSLIFIFIKLSRIYQSNIYTIICLSVLILPSIFQDYFRNFFKRRAYIYLNNELISLTEFSNKNDDIYKEYVIKWEDIESFYFTGNKSALKRIICNLKNGETRKIIFYDYEINIDALNDETHLFRIFYLNAMNYNKINNANIFVNKGFASSKSGWTTLIVVSLLLLIWFVVNFIYEPASSYIPILGLVGYFFGYFSGRSKELDTYRRMNELPSS